MDEGDDDMTDLHCKALHCIDVIDKKFDTVLPYSYWLVPINRSTDRSITLAFHSSKA